MAYPLLTERLSIEPLSLADLDDFVAYRQDPEIARYQSWDLTYSKEQAKQLIESQTGVLLPAPGQWLQLAIHEKTSGRLVGDLAIHAIRERDLEFEIGFTIAKNHQRQGFATEAASRLLTYLFSEVGARVVVAQPDSRNTASKQLLKTLGFEIDQSKSWFEEFKGEEVKVEYFLLNLGRNPKSGNGNK